MLLFEGENGPLEALQFLEKKAGAGVWSMDFSTRKMAWSDGFFDLLGLQPGSVEPSYTVIVELMHPDDRRPAGHCGRPRHPPLAARPPRPLCPGPGRRDRRHSRHSRHSGETPDHGLCAGGPRRFVNRGGGPTVVPCPPP